MRAGRIAVAGGLAATAVGCVGVAALEPAAADDAPRHATADNGASFHVHSLDDEHAPVVRLLWMDARHLAMPAEYQSASCFL